MFEYTGAALSKILRDFKRIRIGITVGVHLLSIVYLIYALATQTGFLIANIALLALTATYFVFFLIMENKQNAKKMKRRIKTIYGWCKRLIKLPILGIAVYGLALAQTDFDPISFLMTLLMIIGWILEFLFYFIIQLVEIEKAFLLDSLHKDLLWTGKIPFIGEKLSNAVDSIPLSENAEEHYKKLEPIIEQRAQKKQEKQQVSLLEKIQIKFSAREQKLEIKATAKQEKAAAKKAKKERKQTLLLPENEIAVADETKNKKKKKDKKKNAD
ncbi:MAG: hypothetical protein IJV83_02970 [Clostridia bacterium]|nr:hypothetical protein [Clostridia bacterium]